LPLHTSISVTLDQADMKSSTKVVASSLFDQDKMFLNGSEEDINNKRIQNVLAGIRARIHDLKLKSEGNDVVLTKEELLKFKIHIHSVNNFPTASGLASSASGYACLVFSLATLFGIEESFTGELSALARIGSGSACRSLYGGWVQWLTGEKKTGEDSYAVQLADHSHWPLDIFIVVVNKGKKEVSSTSGMQNSVVTSELLKYRTSHVVPQREERIKKAISERNFQNLAEEVMKDSNSFHSVCSDTYPPIFYLNDTSKRIIHLVHAYNNHYGKCKAAYTFDAGPNAVIFVQPEDAAELKALLEFYFPVEGTEAKPLDESLQKFMSPLKTGDVQRIISTRIGPGPFQVPVDSVQI